MSFKTMQKLVLGFIAFVFVLIILSGLTGCGPSEPFVRGTSGAPLIGSVLVAETQGCKIYEVNTSSLSVSHLYLTKCDFDKTSSVDVRYTAGKTQVEVVNVSTPPVVTPRPPTPKEIAMAKLTINEQEILGLK